MSQAAKNRAHRRLSGADQLVKVINEASDRVLRFVLDQIQAELLRRAAAEPPRSEFDEIIALYAEHAKTPAPTAFNELLKEPSGLWQGLGHRTEPETEQALATPSEVFEVAPPRFPPPIVPRSMIADEDSWSERSVALDEVLDAELDDTVHFAADRSCRADTADLAPPTVDLHANEESGVAA